MIIKSRARTNHQELAKHLSSRAENEQINCTDSRYIWIQDDVQETIDTGLEELNLFGVRGATTKTLFHISVSPDTEQEMSEQDWQVTWEEVETEFKLENQEFLEVTHTKGGRTHRHRVYNKVGRDGKAINTSFNYLRNEKVSLLAELRLGHELTKGRHGKAVITQLQKEGKHAIADKLLEAGIGGGPRPAAKVTWDEYVQGKRTKIDPIEVGEILQQHLVEATSGQDFAQRIQQDQLYLARGDGKAGTRSRATYVVMDATGNVHGLRRRLGLKAAEVKDRLNDVPLESLPSVEQMREQIREGSSDVKPQIELIGDLPPLSSEELAAERFIAVGEEIAQDEVELIDKADLELIKEEAEVEEVATDVEPQIPIEPERKREDMEPDR